MDWLRILLRQCNVGDESALDQFDVLYGGVVELPVRGVVARYFPLGLDQLTYLMLVSFCKINIFRNGDKLTNRPGDPHDVIENYVAKLSDKWIRKQYRL